MERLAWGGPANTLLPLPVLLRLPQPALSFQWWSDHNEMINVQCPRIGAQGAPYQRSALREHLISGLGVGCRCRCRGRSMGFHARSRAACMVSTQAFNWEKGHARSTSVSKHSFLNMTPVHTRVAATSTFQAGPGR